ncbi:hypothetical protein Q5P01_014016 [Channa striata]|uniref:Shugoshin C-terminal domain-containing protein n=1 Tax=Channa striata TaxID=64152 RepID=A0AA88MLK0_CHASR|nr:hypothetical protein Q5P01_014016 [Channa striata]
MDRTSSNNETRELGSVEQGFLPSPGSNCDAEKPSALMDESIVLQHLDSEPHWHGDRTFEDTQSSSKRPWVATQDSGSLDLDANSNNNHNEPLLYEECSSDTEFQKTKKARREEKSRSSKKKALQKECEDHSNDKKKKKKSSCRTKGFRSDVGLTDVPEPNDPSRLRRIELDRNKYPPEDLPEGDSHSEISDAFLTDSKPTESKSSVDLNSKQRGRKSKLQTSTKARNLRETFVVYKPQDPVSLTGTKMSGDSDAHIYRDEAVHQSLGRLLMDEVPPWLATDVSVVDTELGSLLTSPTRDTLTEKSAPVTTETSPAGRVLTSLTNTMTPSDSENRGRTRRGKCVVSYKEPTLNSKIRRGDKFTDSMFLRSPVFKDGKKKKTQKKTVKEPTMERSILVE